uniref:Coronin n=1 Tax=Ditylenchus dipsaci TaxID=166011 RepID=A0A915D2L2_9BILA
MESFEPSTGLLVPLYDMDSGLLFLAGKGSCKFTLTEINAQKTLLSRLHEQSLPDQSLGACLIPKKVCDVMNGEVQRIHQLTKNSVVPIQCIVPRRSYQNFHDDLFPETIDSSTSNSQEWLSGINKLPSRVSLNPDGTSPQTKQPEPQVKTSNGSVSNGNVEPRKIHYQDVMVKKEEEQEKSVSPEDSSDKENTKALVEKKAERSETKTQSPPINPIPVRMRSSAAPTARTNSMQPVAAVQQRRVRPKSCVVGTVQSKFRHVEVITAEKKSVFINLRNVNNRLPIESNGFCVSEKFAAIPLAGTAGSIAILQLKHPVKLPDGVIDDIKNGLPITDLQIQCIGSKPAEEPKEDSEVVEEGMKLADLIPSKELNIGNGKKVTQIRYNPTASGIIAVGIANGTIQIWNLLTEQCVLQINAHLDGILSLAWSADGLKLASVGRDCMLKVFEPQLGADCCVCERKVLESSRGARVLFVCEDSIILVVGFSRQSNRQCALYRTADLHQLVNETIDTSTQPLIPVYDYDTSVLFLTGKGDRTIQMFEVSAEVPHFLRLSPFTGSTGHQAIALQQKNMCSVMNVEFQRGWRLTEKTLEKISFRVPRIKKDLFQRDVFPNALVTWKCLYSAKEWEDGVVNNLNFENCVLRVCKKIIQTLFALN